MDKCNILFLPHNVKLTVTKGENLIRAAMRAGVHINASCGGEGVCGKCRIIIEDGNVGGGITEKLDKKDVEKGYRQACLSHALSDLVVRIPIESEVDAGVLNLQKTPRKTARIWEMNLEELKDKGLFMPPVEKKYLELPEPTSQDNLPDVTRLISFLKAKHDEHRLVVELPVIRKISDILRQGNFKVTATLARPVLSGRKTHIIHIQPGDTTDRNYAIAVDVGTTTVYAQLVDLISGNVLAQFGDYN
ncbi:MAG TPA: ferredoxin, partial [Desulfobacteraceae bacterium]|nr:ferredoxin [Desulfobacteraceae bacterium]